MAFLSQDHFRRALVHSNKLTVPCLFLSVPLHTSFLDLKTSGHIYGEETTVVSKQLRAMNIKSVSVHACKKAGEDCARLLE